MPDPEHPPIRFVAPMPGIEDPLYFFSGAWAFLRRVEDKRQRLEGSQLGEARFMPDGDGLRYRESGQLALGDHRGTGHRSYLYRFPGNGQVEILFESGDFFLALDLSDGSGTAEHLCERDRYRARFIVEDSYRWRNDWIVSGPRKDYVLTTWYLRFREPATDDLIDPLVDTGS